MFDKAAAGNDDEWFACSTVPDSTGWSCNLRADHCQWFPHRFPEKAFDRKHKQSARAKTAREKTKAKFDALKPEVSRDDSELEVFNSSPGLGENPRLLTLEGEHGQTSIGEIWIVNGKRVKPGDLVSPSDEWFSISTGAHQNEKGFKKGKKYRVISVSSGG